MGCCCVQKQEDKQHQAERDYEQETTDYRIKKGTISINVVVGDISSTDCNVIISSCDCNGKSPWNKLLDSKTITEQLQSKQHRIGDIIKVEGQKIYLFIVLPIYLGVDRDVKTYQQILKELMDQLIAIRAESFCIEDIGVKRFGFPRQIVARQIVETLSSNLNRLIDLRRIDLISLDPLSKILIEHEVQIRKDQLKASTSQQITKSGSFEQESSKQESLN